MLVVDQARVVNACSNSAKVLETAKHTPRRQMKTIGLALLKWAKTRPTFTSYATAGAVVLRTAKSSWWGHLSKTGKLGDMDNRFSSWSVQMDNRCFVVDHM